jgi:hypothetical protein
LGHLQPLLIRKILDIAVLCLRSCSIVAAESDPNLGAKTHPHDEMIGPSPVKLFLREPLAAALSGLLFPEQGLFHHEVGTPHPAVDENGAARAVELTGSALHALLRIRQLGHTAVL